MKEPYRICVLGYGRLTETARRAAAGLALADTEVLVRECNVDGLPEAVREAARLGCEVFVGGFANAASFFRRAEGHLVEIRVQDTDYLLSIQRALALGRRPVLAVYRYARQPDLELYARLSGAALTLVDYEDGGELYDGLRQSGGDVVIGAAHAVEAAGALGLPSVLVYPGEKSVAAAIRRARQLAATLRRERRSQAVTRAILHNAAFGLLVSDEEDRIQLFNRAAQQLTGIAGADARGKRMAALFPAFATAAFLADGRYQAEGFHLVGGAMCRCTQTKIACGNQIIGVLTTLHPESRGKRRTVPPPPERRAAALLTDLPAASPAMGRCVSAAALYADRSAPLLLVGEEGAGRETLAQCLHNASSRQEGPYVRVDLAAVGAYDAGRYLLGRVEPDSPRPGLLEQGVHGTVLLEHLADAAPQAIRCVLDVVASGRLLRLGETSATPVDIRFLTAVTPEELERLPPGLVHQLGVFRLDLPPLRRRKEDLPLLFAQLLHRQEDFRQRPAALTPAMEELLAACRWPGNLHQLSAVCQRYAQALGQTAKPSAAHRYRLLLDAIGEEQVYCDLLGSYPALAMERPDPLQFQAGVDALRRLLRWNGDQIAAHLGVSRTTLWRRLKSS